MMGRFWWWEHILTEWSVFQVRHCPHWWRPGKWMHYDGHHCPFCGAFTFDPNEAP